MADNRIAPAPRWPDTWKREGYNGAFVQAQRALRYLADHDRPSGGEQFPNSACCHLIADELEITREAFVALIALDHEVARLRAALQPFADVCEALDYWTPEVLPALSFPIEGTLLANARADCPEAIVSLSELDFRRAREVMGAGR